MKVAAKPVTEVKPVAATISNKKAEKVQEVKSKPAQKQVELKSAETPKPKEAKAESKSKKAPKKIEEPVAEVVVTPEPVAKVQVNQLTENDINDGWNLVEKWKKRRVGLLKLLTLIYTCLQCH